MEKSERKSKKKHKHKLEDLRPMASYVSDRPALLSQLFSALPKDKMLAMLPPVLRDVPHDELRADCLEILLGLSARRIRSILRGEQLGSSSSSETDSQLEASRESSPDQKSTSTSAPELPNENCSLLEIVELQLRARAIRAALSHGETNNGNTHPPPPKKCSTPPIATSENNTKENEIEAVSTLETVVEAKVSLAKKRPVLVGPLKRLGKRLLLTANNGSSPKQSSIDSALPGKKSISNVQLISKRNSKIGEGEASVSDDEVCSRIEKLSEIVSVTEALVPETIKVEHGIDENSKVRGQAYTGCVCAQINPEPSNYQATSDEPRTEVQDATWVDRRLQQAASPTLRSSLIGTTRHRLANNDTAVDSSPAVKRNQFETSLLANGPLQIDANEGSVTQYDSLVSSNALDIEPLVLNYEED